ncbi:MAG: ADP-ribosylglycohydrolase family protein [Myxococcota bacterium]
MKTNLPADRLDGALLGCALGDALGLPAEGQKPARVARLEPLVRYRLFGRTGFVSDDTEQTALLAQALLEGQSVTEVVARFRRHLRWWFARLPFGIGLATLRSCLKLWLGFARSGVASAGNGAVMRAPIIGVAVEDARLRAELVDAVSRVTHTHPLALAGARYVAEVAATLAREEGSFELAARQALAGVTEPTLAAAIARALETPDSVEAAQALGTTGFTLHTVALCTWAARHATEPLDGIQRAIRAGGDTDTHAAIVGAWLGARFGAAALPDELVRRLHDGPFGPSHLRALGLALRNGDAAPAWSALGALARNLALYPVVLAHGLRHLA